jgi:hypothetical protein
MLSRFAPFLFAFSLIDFLLSQFVFIYCQLIARHVVQLPATGLDCLPIIPFKYPVPFPSCMGCSLVARIRTIKMAAGDDEATEEA